MKKLMLIISLLSVLAITNAQVEEKNILSADEVQKNELIVTPEIKEMMVSSLKNFSEAGLSDFGIKNREQLDNLQMGKTIPIYRIINEKLTFMDKWLVFVMSNDESLFISWIKREDNGQYRWAGSNGGTLDIHNYDYKDSIIGFLEARIGFLIIRKENKDIFIALSDYTTGEYLKKEYRFSEVINLLKKK